MSENDEQLPVTSEQGLESRVGSLSVEAQRAKTDAHAESSQDSPPKDKKESQGKSEALETPSPLRGTPPSQGESLNEPQASSPMPQASEKTQGVRPPRGNVSQILHGAAKKAAHSNSRNDVHEYMRLRRSYV